MRGFGEKLLMFSHKDSGIQHSSAQLRSPPPPPPQVPFMAHMWSRYSLLYAMFYSYLLHPPSVLPFLCLLHSIYAMHSPPLLLQLLWLNPAAVFLKVSYQTHQKEYIAVAACSLYMHMCVFLPYNPCTFLFSLPYVQSLFSRVNLLFLFVPWKLYSLEEAILPRIHFSLHNTRVRACRSQSAQNPENILMVLAYAWDVVALSSLVMPVGCPQSFPPPSSLTLVHVSLSVACSLAVVLHLCLCLFLLALFPGANTCIPRERSTWRGRVVILHRCMWLFASASLSLDLWASFFQPVFPIKFKQCYWHSAFLFHWQSLPAEPSPLLFNFHHFIPHSNTHTFKLFLRRNFPPGENSWRLLHITHLQFNTEVLHGWRPAGASKGSQNSHLWVDPVLKMQFTVFNGCWCLKKAEIRSGPKISLNQASNNMFNIHAQFLIQLAAHLSHSLFTVSSWAKPNIIEISFKLFLYSRSLCTYKKN